MEKLHAGLLWPVLGKQRQDSKSEKQKGSFMLDCAKGWDVSKYSDESATYVQDNFHESKGNSNGPTLDESQPSNEYQASSLIRTDAMLPDSMSDLPETASKKKKNQNYTPEIESYLTLIQPGEDTDVEECKLKLIKDIKAKPTKDVANILNNEKLLSIVRKHLVEYKDVELLEKLLKVNDKSTNASLILKPDSLFDNIFVYLIKANWGAGVEKCLCELTDTPDEKKCKADLFLFIRSNELAVISDVLSNETVLDVVTTFLTSKRDLGLLNKLLNVTCVENGKTKPIVLIDGGADKNILTYLIETHWHKGVELYLDNYELKQLVDKNPQAYFKAIFNCFYDQNNAISLPCMSEKLWKGAKDILILFLEKGLNPDALGNKWKTMLADIESGDRQVTPNKVRRRNENVKGEGIGGKHEQVILSNAFTSRINDRCLYPINQVLENLCDCLYEFQHCSDYLESFENNPEELNRILGNGSESIESRGRKLIEQQEKCIKLAISMIGALKEKGAHFVLCCRDNGSDKVVTNRKKAKIVKMEPGVVFADHWVSGLRSGEVDGRVYSCSKLLIQSLTKDAYGYFFEVYELLDEDLPQENKRQLNSKIDKLRRSKKTVKTQKEVQELQESFMKSMAASATHQSTFTEPL